jgi:hypothetical protein
MSKLNQFQMRSILRHLDAALVATRRTELPSVLEGDATWHIRMARESLLEAAIADVVVEPPAPEPVREMIPA